jgi:hypothetical protein
MKAYTAALSIKFAVDGFILSVRYGGRVRFLRLAI